MSDKPTVGEVVVAFLEQCGVEAAFGVISIHNMPFLDAIGERGKIRYVCAKGKAGAVKMAESYSRASGKLGVAFTSTGTAAGNAAGAMVEALTAGTALLHITGPIDTPHLDRDHGFVHEAQDQLTMLTAVSKSAYRVNTAEEVLDVFKRAVCDATTAPTGPVSVEVPIDIQQTIIDWPEDLSPLPVQIAEPNPSELDKLADSQASCKRPLLWLGGGAGHAGGAVRRLVDLEFGVVTSVQGRGILPEDHPETHYQIVVDPSVISRPYTPEQLVLADSAPALSGLDNRLSGKLKIVSSFLGDLQTAKSEAVDSLRDEFKPYDRLVDSVSTNGGQELIWVRDVTVSNSTWGNRDILLNGPYDGVHALGGGIGQGMQMAIGAAIALPDRKVICLVGDGGLQVNIGELTTAVQEGVNISMILMNSRDYEVIKNIQNATYSGRKHFSDIYAPDFEAISTGAGWTFQILDYLSYAETTLAAAVQTEGATMIEVDMAEIGPYARAFGGPPVRAADAEKGR